MKDPSKTNPELIEEISILKQKIKELEQSESDRKQAEEALRESEEKYRNIFNDAILGIYQTTPEGRLLRANPALARMYGYDTPEELINSVTNLAIQIYVNPEDREIFKRILLREGVVEKFETRLRKKSGEIIWVSINAHALKDTQGNISSYEGTIEDITERKRAEKALRENEERLRTIVEASLDAIIAVNAEGQLVLFNGAAQELFQYSKEEALNQPANILLREEIGKIHQERLERFLNTGVGQCGHIGRRMEKLFRRKDGSLFEAEASMSGGRLDGLRLVVLVIHDITSRKQTEKALQESEQKYRSIFENTVEGIFQSTPEGIYITVNPAHARMYGYDSPEKMIKRITNITEQGYVNPEDRISFKKILEEQGVIEGFETQHYKKDGSIVWASINARAVKDEAGKVLYYEGTVEDITERKQAEEALRESEENFRRSLDDSPLGVRIVTIEGETVYANRAMLNIYGYDSIEELRTTPLKERYTPESYAEFQIRKEKRRQGEYDPFEYEVSIVRKNGEVRHLQVFRKEILWNGERQFQTVYQDITERKQMEKTLRESEERYRSLASSVDLMYLVDRDCRYRFMNEGHRQRFGIPLEEIIGRRYDDFHSEENSKEFAEKVKEVLETGKPIQHEHKSKRDERYFLRTFSPVKDLDERITAVTVVSKDITERKRAEEEKRRLEERSRKVVEDIFRFIPEGVLVFSRKMKLLRQNQAFRELVSGYAKRLGFAEDELENLIIDKIKAGMGDKNIKEIRISRKHETGK
jgi:PAS domain S-box-containing protein